MGACSQLLICCGTMLDHSTGCALHLLAMMTDLQTMGSYGQGSIWLCNCQIVPPASTSSEALTETVPSALPGYSYIDCVRCSIVWRPENFEESADLDLRYLVSRQQYHTECANYAVLPLMCVENLCNIIVTSYRIIRQIASPYNHKVYLKTKLSSMLTNAGRRACTLIWYTLLTGNLQE